MDKVQPQVQALVAVLLELLDQVLQVVDVRIQAVAVVVQEMVLQELVVQVLLL